MISHCPRKENDCHRMLLCYHNFNEHNFFFNTLTTHLWRSSSSNSNRACLFKSGEIYIERLMGNKRRDFAIGRLFLNSDIVVI